MEDTNLSDISEGQGLYLGQVIHDDDCCATHQMEFKMCLQFTFNS